MMTDMPKAGFLCSGKTPLALSVSISCAYKMMDILQNNGFLVGACHTEITEPLTKKLISRAENTLEHLCTCCELVITVGCDGFAVSDIMPDITDKVCEKKAEYFSAVLCGARNVVPEDNAVPEIANRGPSRATAGIYESSLVLNFSGNVPYSSQLLSALIPAIGYTVYNLSGKSARNSAEFRKFLNSSLDFHEVFKKECIVNK